ncbi:MAG: serine--tRNA ligase [Vampirovibrionales bacterium]|nr:serine--tRNA ligase [Vampirovibrionales bacterium]
MLDIKRIRDNAEWVNQQLRRRKPELSVDDILSLDITRRELLQKEETLRGTRNQLTQQIAQAKKAGENTEAIQAETRALADDIKSIEAQKEELNQRQQALLLGTPNLPSEKTPDGADESANVEVKTWGESFKTRPPADVLPHFEIGTQLGILDFERGVKISQSRFSVMMGAGAQLERALISFMLDTHTANGYTEVLPPFLVNRQAMTGTGQLPKFEEDMFSCKDDPLFLIPTAEVPLTNLYSGEILEASMLPISLAAYTPCFRREAGSAGKDTRGLIRQHQFDKVELVKFVTPEQAETEHLKLLADAERILQLLELPYRVIELCSGDMGFAAARCFDIEVWMPAQGVYREISSCSHFTDFQARRADLKYRDPNTGKSALLHTINGSGLAVGRTLAAILENYQGDGPGENRAVTIPKALLPYFRNGLDVIKPLAEAQMA